jgi:DNA-binding LacI/PurR family transcriptional regulator
VKERISSETSERVIAAAKELGYRPNAIARTLVTKRSEILAVVFQRGEFFTTWSGFTAEIMRGVSAGAVSLGYDLMLHTKSVAAQFEADALVDGRVDGALVLRDEGDPVLTGLLQHEFPCVQFFTRSEGTGAPFVDADNYAGGRMATRHLLDLGHRRIGMIRGPLRSTSSNDRYNGYRDALENAGVGVAPERVLSISSLSDMEPLLRLMSQPDRPTALFVWSDEIAFSVVAALKEIGLKVPEDVSVVGFDSLDACDRFSPPLTSVKQPVFEMAQEATRLLISIIRGESVARRQVVYPLSLDVRSSTCPPQEVQNR